MRDRSSFPTLALAVMVAGLVYAYYERALLYPTEQGVALPSAKPPSQVMKAPPIQRKSITSAPPQRISVLETALPATTVATSVVTGKSAASGMFSQFSTHLDFERAYLDAHRAAIPNYYRTFLAQFGATEEQVRKFTDIMMKRAEEWIDIQTVKQSTEQAIAESDIVKLDRASRIARDEALRALFGNAAPDLLKQHKNTFAQREFVSSLTGPAFAAGHPLSQSQCEQLVKLITLTNVGMPGGTDYETFYYHSAATLTPVQLELLRAAFAPRQQRSVKLR